MYSFFCSVKLMHRSNFRVQGMFFQQLYCIPIVLHLSLEIMCMHFILSGPHTSLHICNHIHYKNCNMIFRKWRGGPLEFFRKFIRFGSATLPFVFAVPLQGTKAGTNINHNGRPHCKRCRYIKCDGERGWLGPDLVAHTMKNESVKFVAGLDWKVSAVTADYNQQSDAVFFAPIW